jgi:RNA polymerase sigma factor (sigma-70 family)
MTDTEQPRSPRDEPGTGASGKTDRGASGPAADLDNTEAARFADLIRRVRAGDNGAATELVRRYEPAIRRVVRVHLRDPRLRRVLDSTDVCQSVLATFFVRANLGQYELDTPESLLRLLATIARHKVTNLAHRQQAARRDYRRELILGEHDAQLRAAQSDPGEQAAARELLAKVRERLSDEERQLAERRGEGESWAEIARAVGGSPESVRKKLARALDRVLGQLGIHEGGDE